jgi:hypothetical protein
MGTIGQNEVYFLWGWQRSLSKLPEGVEIYVVFGCGDRPDEPEKVFLDYAIAALWMAKQGKDALNFKIESFVVYRESRSDLTYLKRGQPTMILKDRDWTLCALPSDRELEASEAILL